MPVCALSQAVRNSVSCLEFYDSVFTGEHCGKLLSQFERPAYHLAYLEGNFRGFGGIGGFR